MKVQFGLTAPNQNMPKNNVSKTTVSLLSSADFYSPQFGTSVAGAGSHANWGMGGGGGGRNPWGGGGGQIPQSNVSGYESDHSSRLSITSRLANRLRKRLATNPETTGNDIINEYRKETGKLVPTRVEGKKKTLASHLGDVKSIFLSKSEQGKALRASKQEERKAFRNQAGITKKRHEKKEKLPVQDRLAGFVPRPPTPVNVNSGLYPEWVRIDNNANHPRLWRADNGDAYRPRTPINVPSERYANQFRDAQGAYQWGPQNQWDHAGYIRGNRYRLDAGSQRYNRDGTGWTLSPSPEPPERR